MSYRKIIVDNVEYHWVVTSDDGVYIRELKRKFQPHEVHGMTEEQYETEVWWLYDEGTAFPITPRKVRELIEHERAC